MAAIVGILPRNKETYSPGLHSAVTQWEDPPNSVDIGTQSDHESVH